ncbi:MAG TPA: Tol-Pal system beta propeller repeat protein TolB [Myxococcales bacterium]|nr:Tol-Pal system beta propeller repeat protein TolB [Myxococcales bacterium]
MIFLLSLLLAADRPVIDLSGGRVQAYPLAMARPLGAQDAAVAVQSVLGQDFERSGLFKLLDPASFLASPNEPLDKPEYPRWQAVGAQALVKVSCEGGAEIRCDMRLYDVARGQELMHGTYSAPKQVQRQIAHRFGDDVVRFFTQEPGVFQTRIAYVRETEAGKQIVVADWDGANATALTGASINLLPAWTPDGRTIAFTSFRDGSGAHIFTVDVATKQVKPLVLMGDFATGACYAPDGLKFLFSSSLDDNTDIYVSQADGSAGRRLTDARGIDISASYSPDGKRFAFVSERAGSPQIYSMAADGTDVRRLTFQGNYNQEPAWSPKGDLIAFSGRDEHRVFDLYTVAVDTGKVTRLTQNQGTNEKPSWAPNGRYILFSSTRGGRRQLYVMQPDGSNQRAVTSEHQGASDPAWGPLPNGK